MSEQTINSPEELEKVLQALVAQLGPIAVKSAKPSMEEAMDYLLMNVPGYPQDPPPKGGMKDASPKARAWFFWAVKNGKIPGWKWVEGKPGEPAHPEGRYRQSGHLGQSITTQVSELDAEVTGEIGTNAPYAPWVIGPEFPGEDIGGKTMYQARIHEGRWYRLQEVVAENVDDAWAVFEDELLSRMSKAFAEG